MERSLGGTIRGAPDAKVVEHAPKDRPSRETAESVSAGAQSRLPGLMVGGGKTEVVARAAAQEAGLPPMRRQLG